jgi:hypothetical protein
MVDDSIRRFQISVQLKSTIFIENRWIGRPPKQNLEQNVPMANLSAYHFVETEKTERTPRTNTSTILAPTERGVKCNIIGAA